MSRTAQKAQGFKNRLEELEAAVDKGANEFILQAGYDAVHIQLIKLGYEKTVQHTLPKHRGACAICSEKLAKLKEGLQRELSRTGFRMSQLARDPEDILLQTREKLLLEEKNAELLGIAFDRKEATKLRSDMLDSELKRALIEEETLRLLEYTHRLERVSGDGFFLEDAKHYAIFLTGSEKLISWNDAALSAFEGKHTA